MPYLAAAVVVVGVLCVLDLLLTVAVIRKLRALSAARAATAADGALPQPGTIIGGLDASDVTGHLVDDTWLRGTKLVILMSATCSACMTQLPSAKAYAGTFPGGRDAVLIAVDGQGGHSAEIVSALDGLGRLVTGPSAASVAATFNVTGFPGFVLVADARVRSAAHSVSALSALSEQAARQQPGTLAHSA
jgi:hypothetical protein